MRRPLYTLLLSLTAATLFLAAATGCGTARRGAPVQPAFEVTEPRLVEGQRVFMAFCHSCHPGGAAGLGPALNNKPLPGFLIRFQVRNGLGAMPAFGEDLIPPEDLDALVAYLVTLRRHDG